MTPSQHFLLSFTASLFTGIALALSMLFMQDWISARGIYPPIVMIGAFFLGHTLMRLYFRSCVRVNCIFGCGKKAYSLKGRSDRFRCEQCGNDM